VTCSTGPAGEGAHRGCWYDGCPPPPLGFPGPTRGGSGSGLQGGAGGGLPCDPFPGPPGPGWQSGHGGGGSEGTALTSPHVSADVPTPIAIAAAPARRLTYIFCWFPSRCRCSPGWLPATRAALRPRHCRNAKRDPTSCLYELSLTLRVRRTSRAVRAAKCPDA
jgi:hypothetical protein